MDYEHIKLKLQQAGMHSPLKAITELEEREIKLEAVIQAYYQLVESFLENFPVNFPQFKHLENVSMALFNTAEVREGIEELVDFNIEYES